MRHLNRSKQYNLPYLGFCKYMSALAKIGTATNIASMNSQFAMLVAPPFLDFFAGCEMNFRSEHLLRERRQCNSLAAVIYLTKFLNSRSPARESPVANDLYLVYAALLRYCNCYCIVDLLVFELLEICLHCFTAKALSSETQFLKSTSTNQTTSANLVGVRNKRYSF